MWSQFEYVFFNFFILSSALLAAFLYPKTIWPNWKRLFTSITPVALLFLVWDHFVTNWWWYFNQEFTLDFRFWSLPIGEILFFFTVPIATMILWINWQQLCFSMKPIKKRMNSFRLIIGAIFFLLTTYSVIQSWWYTVAISALVVTMLAIDQFSAIRLWTRPAFLSFQIVIVVLTTIFNGYLTARPVVTYNPTVKSNLYIGTIPVEDYGYGIVLLWSIAFLYFGKTLQPNKKLH